MFDEFIAMTNAARVNLDAYLPGARLGAIALDDFESTTGFGDLGNFHTGHDFSLKTQDLTR